MVDKILAVIPETPTGWYSCFYVHSLLTTEEREHVIETIVFTIDMYTYRCSVCMDSENCQHVKAVQQYVMQDMSQFKNVESAVDKMADTKIE